MIVRRAHPTASTLAQELEAVRLSSAAKSQKNLELLERWILDFVAGCSLPGVADIYADNLYGFYLYVARRTGRPQN